jgi:hypothetical protein
MRKNNLRLTIFAIIWLIGSVQNYRVSREFTTAHRHQPWTQERRYFAITGAILCSWMGLGLIYAIDWSQNHTQKQADW